MRVTINGTNDTNRTDSMDQGSEGTEGNPEKKKDFSYVCFYQAQKHYMKEDHD